MFEKEAEELFKKKPLGYEMKPELEIYTDGFKDGYNKALKEQWHDLRKDKNDLPDESAETERTYGSKVYAIFKDRHYYLVDRAALKHYDDVIEWCELPTIQGE